MKFFSQIGILCINAPKRNLEVNSIGTKSTYPLRKDFAKLRRECIAIVMDFLSKNISTTPKFQFRHKKKTYLIKVRFVYQALRTFSWLPWEIRVILCRKYVPLKLVTKLRVSETVTLTTSDAHLYFRPSNTLHTKSGTNLF